MSGLVQPIMMEQSLTGVFFESQPVMSLPQVLSTDFTKEDGQWRVSLRVSFGAIFACQCYPGIGSSGLVTLVDEPLNII